MASGHVYHERFFDYLELSSRRSAQGAVPRINALLQPGSVLDVGCGQGVWLEAWISEGAQDVCGIDGDYVDPSRLAFPKQHFLARNLGAPFDLGRKFDLVQSLEVAEHITEGAADAFIGSLIRHGDIVLFSAAVPGQGGEHHVNEQPLEYWRGKFGTRGFAAYDAVRPLLFGLSDIEPWYRYNCVVYANAAGASRLPKIALAMRVAANERLINFAPPAWRLRNLIIARLPRPVTNALAQAKHRALTARSEARSVESL